MSIVRINQMKPNLLRARKAILRVIDMGTFKPNSSLVFAVLKRMETNHESYSNC